MLLLAWTFINEKIRQLIKLRNRNISTVTYWSNCWRKTFLTQRFSLLFIYPCHIYRTEVTVVNVICRLPPNHWYTKSHWLSGSTCLFSQTFCTRLANSMRKPWFVLVFYNQFHNILRLFDVLPSFSFTTSETMGDYYL